MNSSLDARIAAVAARHHAVLTLAMAFGEGASQHQVESRLATGRWFARYREVYVIAGSPRTWQQELVAACFAGGPRAAASHRSAAEVRQLPGGRTDLAEITCPRWRRAQETGLVVHESKALDDQDVHEVDGIPVVSAELTLVQLGAVYGPRLVESAYDVARRRGLVTEESVRALLQRVGARGRNGIGILRTVVDGRAALAAIPESVMESRLLGALRGHGLPDPVPQFVVRNHDQFVARVDFAYPHARVALEYDSDAFHLGDAHARDTSRRRALTRAGWEVVGVTRIDVEQGCSDVARTVAEVLRRRRAHPHDDLAS